MSINPFVKEFEEYDFDLDYISGWVEQVTTYIMKKKGIGKEKAREVAVKIFKDKFKERKIVIDQKDLKTLDREETIVGLSTYVKTIQRDKLTIAPSFSCYTKVDYEGNKWDSVHSVWTDVNKKERSVFKKKAKEYYDAGDETNTIIYGTLQVAKKVKNNSLSGMYALKKYPLSHHSSHYALTSTTRIFTSTANTISESIVAGTRLYYTPEDVLRHLNALVTYMDRGAIQKAKEVYSLKVPTVKDIALLVLYNSNYYWRNKKYFEIIYNYIETLDELERMSVYYTFDLYHLHKLNKEFIEDMLSTLSSVKEADADIDYVYKSSDYKLNLLYHVMIKQLRGKDKDLYKYKDTQLGREVTGTMKNIDRTMEAITPLVNAFFKSKVVPPNVSKIKLANRRIIILSDTDSTVSTYTHYIKERFGLYVVNDKTVGYAAAAGIFVSETIRNILMLLGVNMNIDKDRIGDIDMKSEYFFSSFLPTHASKHYIENTLVKEMSIMKDMELGYHGVNLIAGNILKAFNDEKDKLVEYIVTSLESGKRIDLRTVIDKIVYLENAVLNIIEEDPVGACKFSNINAAETYKDGEDANNFLHYKLWRDVFADKYGPVLEPPYLALKVNVSIDKKSKCTNYLNNMEDKSLAAKFENFNKRNKRFKYTNFLLPYDIIKNNGLPKEILDIYDRVRAVEDMLSPIYMVASLLGVNKRDGILIKDTYE